jgi:hypothetical protein
MRYILIIFSVLSFSVFGFSKSAKTKIKPLTHKQFKKLSSKSKFKYLTVLGEIDNFKRFHELKKKRAKKRSRKRGASFEELIFSRAFADTRRSMDSRFPQLGLGECIPEVHGVQNTYPCGPVVGFHVHQGTAYLHCVPHGSGPERTWELCLQSAVRTPVDKETILRTLENNPQLFADLTRQMEETCANPQSDAVNQLCSRIATQVNSIATELAPAPVTIDNGFVRPAGTAAEQ